MAERSPAEELALLLSEMRGQVRSPDLAVRRLTLDRLAEVYPVPSDIVVEQTMTGSVRTEWSRSPGVGSGAVMLYLHGGAYAMGSPLSHRHLIAEAGRQAGIKTCAPQYRLAPEHPYPAALDDCLAVYGLLLDLGYARHGIVVAGDSAGGGLALSLLLSLRAQGLPQPACLWLLSPWVDLRLSQPSMRSNAERDLLSVETNLREYADWYLAGTRGAETALFPLEAELGDLPPTMIQVGSTETMLDEAVRLTHGLGAADVPVRLEIGSGLPHVWPLHHPRLAFGRDALAAAGTFIRDCLDRHSL